MSASATAPLPEPQGDGVTAFPPTEAAPRVPLHSRPPAHSRPHGHSRSPHTPPPLSRPPSSGSLGGGRFAPGEMLGGRYRIVELLGHGGMGDVYRAEDLLLGQRVALKFLPPTFDRDAERMERLLSEVRLARQVSHPNVCRVYDVGEADGHRFFSMELVEGDDLATLLRQVGRIPAEKGIEIARQLCAGLAAAHDRGVLHRDLKPANVLVDRSGKVHVADFGLALAETVEGGGALSGSLGYMAPEQLAGREATRKSDLFALGVVLYELFTGRRAHRAHTLEELRQRMAKEPPPRPCEVVPDLDPTIERVILRCLAHEPAERPSSALAVAAALPGGDPLAAALAAGETPSPEMVAAAGGEGGLAAGNAAFLVAGAALLLTLCAWAAAQSSVVHFLPVDKPPAVLEERAREILASLGHHEPARVTAARWEFDRAPLDFLAKRSKGAGRWAPLAGGRLPVQWRVYRQAPRDFRPQSGFSVVKSYEPSPSIPGEAQVEVDTRGRLLGLAIVAPEHDSAAATGDEPRWEALFAAAGLDGAAFHAV
ncbi:MAG TPA: serine/threonine-protein kinase, partial [Thermoanaerobaculia bacterium]|nr:serine/threonine-protein kinase [Thermoanaerobaculia bacterium]